MFSINQTVTDGTTTGVVLAVGPNWMVVENGWQDTIFVNSDEIDATWREVGFTVNEPWQVFRLDGTRFCGYANQGDAIAKNRERFPNGFYLAEIGDVVAY